MKRNIPKIIAPMVFEKKIRSDIEIILVAFDAPTIIPAEQNDPNKTKNMPRISSEFQFGPKQIDKPKKAKMKAISFDGFIDFPSRKKFNNNTQKGKVKKSNTLKLTGMNL